MYPVPPHGKGILHSSVWDVTQPPVASQSTVRRPSRADGSAAESNDASEDSVKQSSLPEGVEPNSVDIAIMIFVLSALHPLEWQRAIANVYKVGDSLNDLYHLHSLDSAGGTDAKTRRDGLYPRLRTVRPCSAQNQERSNAGGEFLHPW